MSRTVVSTRENIRSLKFRDNLVKLIQDNKKRKHSAYLPIFILCDTCYWCATYVDKTRIPAENKCPECNANNAELTSFPIPLRKSFTFDIMTNVEWNWSLRSEQTPDKAVT